MNESCEQFTVNRIAPLKPRGQQIDCGQKLRTTPFRMARDLSEEGAPGDYKPGIAVKLTKKEWLSILEPQIPADIIRILESDLDDAAILLSKPVLKKPRILFIGDCIQFEIMAALAGPCAAAQSDSNRPSSTNGFNPVCGTGFAVSIRRRSILHSSARSVIAFYPNMMSY
jgi:hypothetical protein